MRKERKHKIPRKRSVHFCLCLQKQSSQEIRVDTGSEFAGEFKKICKAGGIQIYSTMNETKAAFA